MQAANMPLSKPNNIVMKSSVLFSLSLLLALGTYVLPVSYAAGAPGAKTSKKAAKAAKSSAPGVGKVMSELTEEEIWVGNKPSSKATYYIYLTSASWCGPCNAEMPHVVEQYAKMRELGTVELVLISADRTQDAAKGFAERYNATFPVLNPSSLKGQLPPGYTAPQGIPNAIIVDKEGTVIRNGHGNIVQQWEPLTVDNPEYATKGKSASSKKKSTDKKKKKEKKK